MYLSELKLHGIKCFESLHLKFPPLERRGGWNVILGENGTGKSTILQAIALGVLGPPSVNRLLDAPSSWVRKGSGMGECEVTLTPRKHEARRTSISIEYQIAGSPWTSGAKSFDEVEFPGENRMKHLSADLDFALAGYGVYRRFEAQPVPPDRGARKRERAVATLFRPESTLNDATKWLQELDYWAKDVQDDPEERARRAGLVDVMVHRVNRLLPAGDASGQPYRVSQVNSQGVEFQDPAGTPIPLHQMSDGYRTMFAMAVDLLRMAWDFIEPFPERLSIFRRENLERALDQLSGVILIDEVDAHLHPKWQREVGGYLQRVFPRFQFIVTTHSPFVAQSAGKDGLFVLRRNPKTGVIELDSSIDSVQGWRVEQVLTSPAFAETPVHSPETQKLMAEHARLKAKQEQAALSPLEQKRLAELSDQLGEILPAPGDTYQIMQKVEQMIREAEKP